MDCDFFDVNFTIDYKFFTNRYFLCKADVCVNSDTIGTLEIKPSHHEVSRLKEKCSLGGTADMKRKLNNNYGSQVTKIKKQTSPNEKPPLHPQSQLLLNSPGQKVDVSGLMRTLVDARSNDKLFQCSFCSYEARVSSSVKRHIELKHLPQSITLNCLHCSATFKLKQGLKVHYMKIHGLLEPAAKAMMPC